MGTRPLLAQMRTHRGRSAMLRGDSDIWDSLERTLLQVLVTPPRNSRGDQNYQILPLLGVDSFLRVPPYKEITGRCCLKREDLAPNCQRDSAESWCSSKFRISSFGTAGSRVPVKYRKQFLYSSGDLLLRTFLYFDGIKFVFGLVFSWKPS